MNSTTFMAVIAKYGMLRIMKEAQRHFFQIFHIMNKKKDDKTNVKKKLKSKITII